MTWDIFEKDVMNSWHHAPPHSFESAGMFMVTGATYLKKPLFDTDERRDYLRDTFCELAKSYGWELRAWVFMPNHYHWIGWHPEPRTLAKLTKHFHSVTASYLNQVDSIQGRKVWRNYWETLLTSDTSYWVRMAYVYQNPVRHGYCVVPDDYPWSSSADWKKSMPESFFGTLESFKVDRVHVPDDF